MTKDQYLQLRQQDNKLSIMYLHHQDLLGVVATLSFIDYRYSLDALIKRTIANDKMIHKINTTEQECFDLIYEQSVSYFDKKFDIQYIQMTITKTIKETITIIR